MNLFRFADQKKVNEQNELYYKITSGRLTEILTDPYLQFLNEEAKKNLVTFLTPPLYDHEFIGYAFNYFRCTDPDALRKYPRNQNSRRQLEAKYGSFDNATKVMTEHQIYYNFLAGFFLRLIQDPNAYANIKFIPNVYGETSYALTKVRDEFISQIFYYPNSMIDTINLAYRKSEDLGGRLVIILLYYSEN